MSVPEPVAGQRFEVQRWIDADPAVIFGLLCRPDGHVMIDSTGMLQSAEGSVVAAVGDTFVVHMDREALGDRPMGRYDVTVVITAYEPEAVIEWTILGTIKPPMEHRYGYRLEAADGGTRVTSYYDWSQVPDRYRVGVFPVIPESGLKATLGILARTVRHD